MFKIIFVSQFHQDISTCFFSLWEFLGVFSVLSEQLILQYYSLFNGCKVEERNFK